MRKMRRVAQVILGLALANQIIGCGQDPYRDQPDDVKNAQGRVIKKVETPIGSDELMMDSSSPRYNFTESKEGSVQLVAKSLRPNTSFSVFIENIDTFPGAKFDAQNLIFTWTPPIGFVQTGKGLDINLHATMVTDKAEGTVRMSRSLYVPLSISKFESVPEIISVEDFGDETVLSGETRSFRIKVRDLSATESPEGVPQIKVVKTDASSYNISYLMSSGNARRDNADPTVWWVPMVLDLRNITNTRSSVEYNVGFIVASHTGKISKEFPFKVRVMNKVSDPEVSFKTEEYFSVPIGKMSPISFIAFDANGDGRISVEIKGMEELPGPSAATCNNSNSKDYLVECRLNWSPDPTATIGKSYFLTVEVTNTPSWLPEPIKKSFTMELRVEATSEAASIKTPRKGVKP